MKGLNSVNSKILNPVYYEKYISIQIFFFDEKNRQRKQMKVCGKNLCNNFVITVQYSIKKYCLQRQLFHRILFHFLILFHGFEARKMKGLAVGTVFILYLEFLFTLLYLKLLLFMS